MPNIKCPCGDLSCAIYDGNAYPGRVIHCRLLSSGGKKKTDKTKQDVTSDKELSVLTDFVEKKIDAQMDRVMELADSATTCMEIGVYSQEIDRLAFLKEWYPVLSDPDWRAWLKKE